MAPLNREISRSDHASLLLYGSHTIPWWRSSSPFVLSRWLGKCRTGQNSSFSHGCAVYKLQESCTQWKPGLTLLSWSAKRLDTVLQTHSLFLRLFQPAIFFFFFDTRGDGHVQIFARNPYPRWNPPSCQKILTGRLYYSGITVARLVGRVFRVKVFFLSLKWVARCGHTYNAQIWSVLLVINFGWICLVGIERRSEVVLRNVKSPKVTHFEVNEQRIGK